MNNPNVRRSGFNSKVEFAVSWSKNPDPETAGKEAAESALKALDSNARGVIYYVYYQDKNIIPDESTQETACKADVSAGEKAVRAVSEMCRNIPNIGCKARPMTYA